MVVIINYGMGNIHSVYNQCRRLGYTPEISSKPEIINKADKLILPGVGHFKKGMEKIYSYNLIDSLNEKVLKQKTPILGICLGMHLFCDESEEGDLKGLGWINAKVVKFNFEKKKGFKIPHMGWNNVLLKKNSLIAENVNESDEFYFVHSYHVVSKIDKITVGSTNYCYNFISVFEQDNIYGTQFHPEKSHKSGLKILKNFLGNI
tara:strand:+ start:848 stop:1462 length:615 start_codon:yes stop_codon:yes gene_type:complete